MKISTGVVCLVLALVALFSVPAFGQRYHIDDLRTNGDDNGPIDGDFSNPAAISKNGIWAVSKASPPGGGSARAAYWRRGNDFMLDLGPWLGAFNELNDVNNAGIACGSVMDQMTGVNGAITINLTTGLVRLVPIPSAPAGYYVVSSVGLGISSNGTIVGRFTLNDGRTFGFVSYPDGTTRNLGPGVATALNDKVDVAGYVTTGNTHEACVWRAGNNSPTMLGTLGGINSFARGINSQGNVVGFSQVADSNIQKAFWHSGVDDDEMKNLLTLGGNNSQALDTNSRKQTVGSAQLANGAYAAALFRVGAAPVNLNTVLTNPIPGVFLESANAINEQQIVCRGVDYSDPNYPTMHTYILTPDPVPGPGLAKVACAKPPRR